MKKAIPLALLLLLIVVVVLTVGERSIRSGNQALVRHHPAPAMAAQGTQTPDSQGSELSAATMHDVTATQDVTAVTEAKTMKPTMAPTRMPMPMRKCSVMASDAASTPLVTPGRSISRG